MSEILAGCLMVAGTLLMVVAGVGVVRMPDALCRAHAVAKAVSLGISLILLGLWARLGANVIAAVVLSVPLSFTVSVNVPLLVGLPVMAMIWLSLVWTSVFVTS